MIEVRALKDNKVCGLWCIRASLEQVISILTEDTAYFKDEKTRKYIIIHPKEYIFELKEQ